MSQVKLNPYVDLGLSADPNYQPNQADPNVTSDLGSIATSTSTTQPVDQNQQQATPNFGGISDLSSFAKNTEPTPAPVTESVNPYSAVNPKDLEVADPSIKVSSTVAAPEEKSNTLFLILALILLLASIGVVVYFALVYFKVI